jgi:hypothetical protein
MQIQQVQVDRGRGLVVTQTTGFPTAGTIAVANELITYTHQKVLHNF